MPVDYSKWDKLQYSDDDDQSENEDSLVDSEDDEPVHRAPASSSRPHSEDSGAGRRPVVTRLDHPSSISIGPSGIEVQHPPRATASPFLASPPQRFAPSSQNETANAEPVSSTELVSKQADDTIDDNCDDLEDDLLLTKLTRNGQKCERYFWSQTREMATFVVVLPSLTIRGGNIYNFSISSTGSSDVPVDGAARLSFAVSTPATGVVERFSFSLRYPIKVDEDIIDGCWQLHTLPTQQLRLLVIELHKDPIGHQLYLWWDRACVGETPIDTTKLQDRSQERMAPSSVQQVWDEAHEEFRRRNKERHQRSTGENEEESA